MVDPIDPAHTALFVMDTRLVEMAETAEVVAALGGSSRPPGSAAQRAAQGGRRTVSSQCALTTAATETMSSKADGFTR